MSIEEVRRSIPALGQSVYLNTGGTGPPRSEVTETVVSLYRDMMMRGPDAPPVRKLVAQRTDQARSDIASLLGIDKAELAFTRSVSEGISIVAWGLDWTSGDEVIVTDQEHPSNLLPWYSLSERYGIRVKQVRLSRDRGVLLKRLRSLISPRTRLLALSHVTAENGLLLPIEEISRLARESGVLLLVDGAQAVGQLPVNVRTMGPEFYAVTGHKWLLAGHGAGALYVRSDALDLLRVSWTGAGAEAFIDRATGEHRWNSDSSRFEFGNRFWPACVGMGTAASLIRKIGVSETSDVSSRLASFLIHELADIPGVHVDRSGEDVWSPGIVTFYIDGISGSEAVQVLWEEHSIVCRAAFQGQGVRISVAFFNLESELNVLVGAVTALANGKHG